MAQPSTRRFIVLGGDHAVGRLHESFQQQAPRHWEWVGVVTDAAADIDAGVSLGTARDLGEIVARHRPTDLVVAVRSPDLKLSRSLLALARGGLRVACVRAAHEELTRRVTVDGDDRAWEIALGNLSRRGGWARATKRMLDLVAGLGAFAVFALILAPVALGLKLERAGSIFVAERRIGLLGRSFTLLSFRTRLDAPARQWPFADAPALTRTGAMMMKFRLDSAPHALAILAGHLSLVGPRAENVEMQGRVERENPVFLARTTVKPGLTGWEQLHRESRSIFDTLRRLEYDLYYVKHQSFRFDLQILARSVLAVLGSRRTAD
jgi:lipopolysaccharide/colanic/teichoic acid biosynthesis glycosyltransferase